VVVGESSGIDVSPSDHMVDINDGDLMRAADVQQAVQARYHGACAGNLNGRPLLHKVVLHVHDNHGCFLISGCKFYELA
jgi:hypothetical protein